MGYVREGEYGVSSVISTLDRGRVYWYCWCFAYTRTCLWGIFTLPTPAGTRHSARGEQSAWSRGWWVLCWEAQRVDFSRRGSSPGQVLPGRWASPLRSTWASAAGSDTQKPNESDSVFSGQTILFSVMRLYTVHSVTVVYKHSYFHT